MPSRVEIEELTKAKEKIEQLLREDFPNDTPAEVSIRAGENFAGEKSLFARVVFEATPKNEDVPRHLALQRRFQLWLLDEFGDDRFPYFEFLGRSELEERAQAQ